MRMDGGTAAREAAASEAAGGAAAPVTRTADSADNIDRLPELLAPAGSLDAALAALAAGADAVYTGLAEPGLDARAAAPGLTFEELADLCALAHAGALRPAASLRCGSPQAEVDAAAPARPPAARVYVTLNALVDTSGLPRAVAAARRALAAGADAFIVADLGLARALSRGLPGVELHLSTQAGAQAAPAVELAARVFGCSRVTVARELSLPEIAAICATGVEVEVFCHGAICISYSGACSFSALARGRSAMRGDCTQPCRQSWRLEDARGRERADAPGDKLLCPKDYLGIRQLPALVRAGVGALKIEGRMKNPDYVFNVVGAYRSALDALAAGETVDVGALERRLGRSFNRGFTDAYLRGDRAGTGRALMSFERSCNQGAPVGVVVERGHRVVTVELADAVEAGDTLEIHTVLPADAGADVPRRWPLVPCPVSGAAGERIAVPCKRRVEPGSEVYVTASARLRHATDEAVARGRAALAALGDSGWPGELGRPAREAEPSELMLRRSAGLEASAGRFVPSPILVRTPERACELLDGGAPEVAALAWQIAEASGAWEPLLPRLTVVLDEVCRAADVPEVSRLVHTARRVVCRNLSQILIARAAGTPFDVAAPLYAENAEAVAAFCGLGAARVWLPDEFDDASAARLAGELAQTGAPSVAGRLNLGPRELMVMEHCLFTTEGPCAGSCATCPRRTEERFLVGNDGRRYPVCVDARGRSRIFEPRG